jgi:hypothetical protein
MAEVFFGIDINNKHDEWYIDIAEEVMKGISEAAVPGAFLVDIMPICASNLSSYNFDHVKVNVKPSAGCSKIRPWMVSRSGVSDKSASLPRADAGVTEPPS